MTCPPWLWPKRVIGVGSPARAVTAFWSSIAPQSLKSCPSGIAA